MSKKSRLSAQELKERVHLAEFVGSLPDFVRLAGNMWACARSTKSYSQVSMWIRDAGTALAARAVATFSSLPWRFAIADFAKPWKLSRHLRMG